MKIKFVPLQPHCFAFGGFEIQMLQTFDALKKSGADVEKLDMWDKNENFEILHLWGLEIDHYNTILWAKKKGKKVVITTLLNYMETPKEKIYNFLSTFVDKVKYLKRIAQLSDSVIVLNEDQRQVAIRYYNSHAEKTQIAPIIINSVYYQNNSTGKNIIDFNDFVLTTGNVCARKNQYNLAQACVELNRNLLIIGNELEGERGYSQKLETLINKNKNIKWIKGVNAADEILIEAYNKCNVFALPSFAEVQPTSAVEAAIVGKPLLLANKEYARQPYFKGAALVNPSSIDEIKEGIEKIVKDPLKFSVDRNLLNDFKEESVAKKYLDIYRSILSE